MENNDKAIGVMDSGVGGLTVLKQLLEVCPNENYIYFGDTKNLPFGEKSKEQLIEIVKNIFNYFEKQNVKAVVHACNTTSATAYDELKDKYDFKIYPLVQTVAKCVAQDKSLKRVAIMATQATVNSRKYKEELQKHNQDIQVLEQACPLFVPMVEKSLENADENEIIESYITPVLKFNPQKIILGCTHYPYLLDKLAKYAPKDLFIDPSKIFANYIKEDLKNSNLLSTQISGSATYIASSEPEKFKENAKLFMQIDKKPELVKL